MKALILAMVLLLPAASAAEVEVREVRVPDRTMAEVPWDASVTVANTGGTTRDVYLLAALYREAPGQDCGPATDPRFRTFTPLLQARLRLPPGAVVTYPGEGERWQQMYQTQHVAPEPRVEEWCVFVAEGEGQALEYLDHEAVALHVRGVNARPAAEFTWTPSSPRATEDVRFVAEASDADGDPLTYAWDFGHFNASGRARGEGREVVHFFYPAERYTVTLRVGDGLQETVVVRNVYVLAEDAPREDGKDAPFPWELTLAALLVAALAWRGRPPRSRPAPARRPRA